MSWEPLRNVTCVVKGVGRPHPTLPSHSQDQPPAEATLWTEARPGTSGGGLWVLLFPDAESDRRTVVLESVAFRTRAWGCCFRNSENWKGGVRAPGPTTAAPSPAVSLGDGGVNTLIY